MKVSKMSFVAMNGDTLWLFTMEQCEHCAVHHEDLAKDDGKEKCWAEIGPVSEMGAYEHGHYAEVYFQVLRCITTVFEELILNW